MFLLRNKLFWFFPLIIFLSFFITESVAQGCNGADGTGIFTGSIANRDNGTICANNPVQPGIMEIDIQNVDESGSIEFEINWDDGSAPERVVGIKIGTNRYFSTVTHLFPPNGGQVTLEDNLFVQGAVGIRICNVYGIRKFDKVRRVEHISLSRK